MKIYKIQLLDYREYIVVSTDPTSACDKLKKYLDKEDLGYFGGREPKVIEIIAETIEDYDSVYKPRNYR